MTDSMPADVLTGHEQLALPDGCACSYALSARTGLWRIVTREHCRMHGRAFAPRAGVLVERARQAAPTASADQLTCPECQSTEFELWLGGRQSGNVSCRGCGLLFVPPGRETASTS